MTGPIVEIDHLMVSVKDSAAAGATFERMGFTATPRSILPGLSNRLICFPEQRPDACNFIELMALDDASKAPPNMETILGGQERPVSLVMHAPDCRAAEAHIRARGLETSPSIDLSRTWTLPSGESIEPAFAVTIPRPGQAPFYWNVCQHKTRQHYLRPEFVAHRNGARALSAIIACAADPDAAAAHYETLWGARRLPLQGGVAVTLGTVPLRIHAPDGLAAAFPGIDLAGGDRLVGFAVGVDDVSAARAHIAGEGLPIVDLGDRCAVPPEAAHGCLVVLEAFTR